jgi:hypothetical protein
MVVILRYVDLCICWRKFAPKNSDG